MTSSRPASASSTRPTGPPSRQRSSQMMSGDVDARDPQHEQLVAGDEDAVLVEHRVVRQVVLGVVAPRRARAAGRSRSSSRSPSGRCWCRAGRGSKGPSGWPTTTARSPRPSSSSVAGERLDGALAPRARKRRARGEVFDRVAGERHLADATRSAPRAARRARRPRRSRAELPARSPTTGLVWASAKRSRGIATSLIARSERPCRRAERASHGQADATSFSARSKSAASSSSGSGSPTSSAP